MLGMEKDGEAAGADGWGSPGSGEGVQSWAKVVQGPSRQPLWTSHKISEGEVEEPQRYFTKVLEFSDAVMEEFRRQWEKVAVFTRSLGQNVPVEWVAKEVRAEGKLDL